MCATGLAAGATAQAPAFVAKAGWPSSSTPLLVDLDNDGHPEALLATMLFSNQSGPSISYRRMLGNGEWAAGPSFNSPAFAQFTIHVALAAADVNGDGNQDVYVTRMVAGAGSGGTGTQPWYDQLWLGDGLGGLTDASQNLPAVRTNVQSAKFADFDGDGDLDLVLSDVSGLLLWINDGTGHFTDQSSRRVEGWSSYVPWRCVVFDADQDGDLDILVSNGWGTFQPTILYENNGCAMFKARSQGITRIAELYVLDADRDGWDDVFAVYPTFATVFASRPHPQPLTLLPQLLPTLPAGTTVYPPCTVVDTDGDGFRDIIANLGQSFQFWQNTNSGFVVVPNALPVVPGVTCVVDYDRDGDIDLVCSAMPSTPGVATILSNTSREIVKVTEPIRGALFSVDVYALASHMMFVGVSTNYVRQPLGTLGLLYVDPSQTAMIATLSYAARGRQTVSFPIPNQAWLVGQLVCMQALDLDLGTSAMHLTNTPSGVIQ